MANVYFRYEGDAWAFGGEGRLGRRFRNLFRSGSTRDRIATPTKPLGTCNHRRTFPAAYSSETLTLLPSQWTDQDGRLSTQTFLPRWHSNRIMTTAAEDSLPPRIGLGMKRPPSMGDQTGRKQSNTLSIPRSGGPGFERSCEGASTPTTSSSQTRPHNLRVPRWRELDHRSPAPHRTLTRRLPRAKGGPPGILTFVTKRLHYCLMVHHIFRDLSLN